MLRLILLKSFYLSIGVFLVALIGSIANGWLLLSIWLIFMIFRFSYLFIENIRKKINTINFLNSIISIVVGISHTELKLTCHNTISWYRKMHIKKTILTSLVGAIICILNILSNGMWARDFLSIFRQRPVESIVYLLLISLIFSLLENAGETKLKKLNEISNDLLSSEELLIITNKLDKHNIFQWLIWIFIVVFTVFIIRTVV